jgi:GrpB-like predicted nucleotidyltransferase (UPF0157 family)
MSTKYPDIEVQLTGNDGNAFAVMGAVQRAMRRHPEAKNDIAELQKEAMSGDYNHLLMTCMEYVTVL